MKHPALPRRSPGRGRRRANGLFAGGGEILRLARGPLEEPTWGALGVYLRANVVGTPRDSAAAEGESRPDSLSHNSLYGIA